MMCRMSCFTLYLFDIYQDISPKMMLIVNKPAQEIMFILFYVRYHTGTGVLRSKNFFL